MAPSWTLSWLQRGPRSSYATRNPTTRAATAPATEVVAGGGDGGSSGFPYLLSNFPEMSVIWEAACLAPDVACAVVTHCCFTTSSTFSAAFWACTARTVAFATAFGSASEGATTATVAAGSSGTVGAGSVTFAGGSSA